MLAISSRVSIPLSEIELNATRSQGAGGQNVNKVATAVHLRFDIRASSLPDFYKTRLLRLGDRRISRDGVVVIKAQRSRSQEHNREDALRRLQQLARRAVATPKKRVATQPPRALKRRQTDAKTRRGRVKALRRPPLE